MNLGIDANKSDQVVRGSTVLPAGNGKKVKVAVFTQGANAEAAKQAGADVVGMEDLAERMQGGDLDFNVVIASPDAMRVVGKLGQLLGPRGLMPNPKVGTVTPDVAGAVENAKAGQVRYRADKAGTVHCVIGNVGFEVDALKQNLVALIARPEQGEARGREGRVPAEGLRVLDDGAGRARGQRDARRARRGGRLSSAALRTSQRFELLNSGLGGRI